MGFFKFRISLRRDWKMREMHKNVWLGNPKETDHFENLVVDGKFIVKTSLMLGWESADWNNLAQDFVQWRVLMITTMIPQFPVKTGHFLLHAPLPASQ
jgi:hypothetical protein